LGIGGVGFPAFVIEAQDVHGAAGHADAAAGALLPVEIFYRHGGVPRGENDVSDNLAEIGDKSKFRRRTAGLSYFGKYTV
jgi:hypothetical protein